MPARRYPFSTHRSGKQVIQLQRNDRRVAAGGSTEDPRAVGTPIEVAGPGLMAWIEEGNSRAGQWVDCINLNALKIIA